MNGKWKRLTAWILCMILLAISFPGCKDQTPQPPQDTQDLQTPEVTEPVTEELPVTLQLVENGKSTYRFVKAEGLGREVISALNDLQSAFKKQAGVYMEICTDILASEESPCEILIGGANRAASKEATKGLRKNDYFVGVYGGKLVLTGGSDESVVKAINWFRQNILKGNVTDLNFSSTQNYSCIGKYTIDRFLCLGTDLMEYTIVIPAGDAIPERWLVANLQEHLLRTYGVELPVAVGASKEYPHEILIGENPRAQQTVGKYEFVIAASGTRLELRADSMYGYEGLKNYFINTLASGAVSEIDLEEGYLYREDVSEKFSSSGNKYLLERAGQIRVMFNNIGGQWRADEDANTALRMNMLAEQYFAYLPDVLALQECSAKCRTGSSDLIGMLKKGGYTEAGTGGCTPVFYREEVLELLECGYQTYSDGMNDPSKSYTWAVFRTKRDQKTFAVVSTHFWWETEDPRVLDAQQLLPVLQGVQAKWNCPIVVGGDFNCTIVARAMTYLFKNGCTDIRNLTQNVRYINTFHAQAGYNETLKCFLYNGAQPINDLDHILLYGNGLQFRYFDVVSDLYATLATDHYPVMTEFDFG